MDDNKPVLLTLHEALRLHLIEAYMAGKLRWQKWLSPWSSPVVSAPA